MKITKIIVIFTFFIASVVGVSALASRSHFESQLIRQSRQLLRANGWADNVQVNFRGRQCILKGEVATMPEKNQLMELVGALDGVDALDSGALLVTSR
ncbi:MAG: hypothetical protein ACI9R3_000105 [Verrucomicrobiales bacterium]|jgi:hypothetical protein